MFGLFMNSQLLTIRLAWQLRFHSANLVCQRPYLIMVVIVIVVLLVKKKKKRNNCNDSSENNQNNSKNSNNSNSNDKNKSSLRLRSRFKAPSAEHQLIA